MLCVPFPSFPPKQNSPKYRPSFLSLKDFDEFKREIDSRIKSGKQTSSVIKVITWHTPGNAQDFSVPESEICEALERTNSSLLRTNSSLRMGSHQSTHSESDVTPEPYVLVMDRGGHSLGLNPKSNINILTVWARWALALRRVRKPAHCRLQHRSRARCHHLRGRAADRSSRAKDLPWRFEAAKRHSAKRDGFGEAQMAVGSLRHECQRRVRISYWYQNIVGVLPSLPAYIVMALYSYGPKHRWRTPLFAPLLSLSILIHVCCICRYCPPELARQLVGDGCFELAKRCNSQLITAESTFDVWSLGVVIFELCTGQSLFAQEYGAK